MANLKNISLVLLFCSSLVTEVYASGSYGGGGGKSAGQGSSSSSLSNDDLVNVRRSARDRAREKLETKKFVDLDLGHELFADVLKNNVRLKNEGRYSEVNYASVNMDKLNSYIDELLAAPKKQVESMNRDNQLAHYINLYNALTIKFINDNEVKGSIKELGSGFPLFRSPWKKKWFKLFGEEQHLDHIEHDLVRGNRIFSEPRIHFAFNCASVGCPALLNEPFKGDKIEEQLETATRNFLRDRKRNRVDLKNKKVEVSSIFKWYREDFEKGWKGFNSLQEFFSTYADALGENKEEIALLKSGQYDIEFLDYDWGLNRIKK